MKIHEAHPVWLFDDNGICFVWSFRRNLIFATHLSGNNPWEALEAMDEADRKAVMLEHCSHIMELRTL